MAGLSFTTKYRNGLSNVLINKVGILPTGTRFKSNLMFWNAIWDTGATNTVITKQVVEKLGLQPVSVGQATTPSGTYTAYKYYVDILLPNNVVINKLLVMEGQPAHCDVLIGMDVISRGDFAVTNYNGKTMFSFRMPSCGEIDFVNNSYLKPMLVPKKPSRNDPCPCGSGKKYKQCCGK